MNLLGDSIVDTDSGQILGNKPLLTIAFDDAALEKKTIYTEQQYFSCKTSFKKILQAKSKLLIGKNTEMCWMDGRNLLISMK